MSPPRWVEETRKDGTKVAHVLVGQATTCGLPFWWEEGWDTAPFLVIGENDDGLVYCPRCWPYSAQVRGVLDDVEAERRRQEDKWGPTRDMPDGTAASAPLGEWSWSFDADTQKRWTQDRFERGVGTWSDILAEEVAEAFAEDDPALLRAELVQVAAVAVAWIENLDRRGQTGP